MTWNYQQIVGVPHSTTIRVARRWIVPLAFRIPGFSALARRGEPVLATGVLVGLLEEATWRSMLHLVPEHLSLAGFEGRYRHVSPALPGQRLNLVVTCTGGHGNRTWWSTSAHHEQRLIGVLEHVLVVTDSETFHQRLVDIQ